MRNKNKKKKNRFVFVIVIFIFISCFYGRFNIPFGFEKNVALAEVSSEESELEKELKEEVSSQLSHLDFSEVETVLDTLSKDAKKLFSSENFMTKVSNIISGEYAEDSKSFFSSVTGIFW